MIKHIRKKVFLLNKEEGDVVFKYRELSVREKENKAVCLEYINSKIKEENKNLTKSYALKNSFK